MRVAFDVGSVLSEPTGVGLFAMAMAHALADELSAEGLLLLGRRADATELPSNVAAVPMPNDARYQYWLQVDAPRAVKRSNVAVAHFSDGLVPIVRSCPTVLSVHDMSVVRMWRTHPLRRYARIPLVLLSPRLADVVIVPSRATASEVMRLTGAKAKNIEIMPYAPQRQIGRPGNEPMSSVLELYKLPRDGYVLCLGTLEPRKNQLRVLAAFEAAIAQRAIPADMMLVFVGRDGWHSEPIKQRILASPLRDRIRRFGYVPAAHLQSLLAGAASAAYPSLYEGFGLPIVEAMACGAPTVTSNLSSMPEVAGDAGFLVDPFDVVDIARGLTEAVNEGMTNRASISARSMAQARRFTWPAAAKIAAEVYRSRFA